MSSTRRLPSVMGEVQPIMRIVEVLPAPFGPRKPNDSPGWTSKSMPSTATKSSKVFTRPRASIRDIRGTVGHARPHLSAPLAFGRLAVVPADMLRKVVHLADGGPHAAGVLPVGERLLRGPASQRTQDHILGERRCVGAEGVLHRGPEFGVLHTAQRNPDRAGHEMVGT